MRISYSQWGVIRKTNPGLLKVLCCTVLCIRSFLTQCSVPVLYVFFSLLLFLDTHMIFTYYNIVDLYWQIIQKYLTLTREVRASRPQVCFADNPASVKHAIKITTKPASFCLIVIWIAASQLTLWCCLDFSFSSDITKRNQKCLQCFTAISSAQLRKIWFVDTWDSWSFARLSLPQRHSYSACTEGRISMWKSAKSPPLIGLSLCQWKQVCWR